MSGRQRITSPQFALDRAESSAKSVFIRARKAETQYARQLRKVARHIGDLVMGLFDADNPASVSVIDGALRRYSGAIGPWAQSVGGRMVAEVAARDRKAWAQVSREMGTALHREIDNAPTGAVLKQRLAEQVRLITSLPSEAADRVHQITLEGVTTGTRAGEIAAEIMRTGEVTKSRAELIARTEVSRTATELTRARAEHVGSTQFIWRTAGDSDVRPSHRALNGKAFSWSDPPECDPGYHALPGAIWNCRCYAEPIIPDP